MLDAVFASNAHAEISPDFVELVFSHRGQIMKIMMTRSSFNQFMSGMTMTAGFEWLNKPDKKKE